MAVSQYEINLKHRVNPNSCGKKTTLPVLEYYLWRAIKPP